MCETPSGNLPCLVDILVLAGFKQPCPVCAANLHRMRDIDGWKFAGEFWTSDRIAPEQQQMIADLIHNYETVPMVERMPTRAEEKAEEGPPGTR